MQRFLLFYCLVKHVAAVNVYNYYVISKEIVRINVMFSKFLNLLKSTYTQVHMAMTEYNKTRDTI